MKIDENGNKIYESNAERSMFDPTYKEIKYDKDGNKIYPSQPVTYAADSLWALWLLIPLAVILFLIGGGIGFIIGVGLIVMYLNEQKKETARRWKLECDIEEKYRKKK